MTSEQLAKVVSVAWSHNDDTSGYVYNEKYPMLLADHFWRRLYKAIVDHEYPPGTTAICGITIPAYLDNLSLVQGAASDLSVSYLTTDTSEQVMDKIIAVYGNPPIDE